MSAAAARFAHALQPIASGGDFADSMTATFLILAAMTVAGMVAAMSYRNLVHCVLALTLGFIGLASLYLLLGAQFVGFAQILVYVGAVAILAVFVVMMTKSSPLAVANSSWMGGAGLALVVFSLLAWTIRASQSSLPSWKTTPPVPDAPVKQIGQALMQRYVLPLEILGLLLTAALIGAVVLAMRDSIGREMP
jgi:NADH-quinone oxidoreductase subunit J